MATARGRRGGRIRRQPPLLYHWGGTHDPLPVQEVRGVGRSGHLPLGTEAPPWLKSGEHDEPFDFCGHVRRLCVDIAGRCEELRHVHTERVLFAVTQARNGRAHGLQARVTPLRFHGGALYRRHRGARYQVQRLFVYGREMLYLMTFCLPRFLNQAFDDKIVTLFHELFHIGPRFDGDLRRHAGRYAVHSSSQHRYDEHMAALARAYLASGPDPDLHAFLRLNFAQLKHRHGSVVGIVVPRPKLVPVTEDVAATEVIHAAVRHP
jgi:predicted metallopeptidase